MRDLETVGAQIERHINDVLEVIEILTVVDHVDRERQTHLNDPACDLELLGVAAAIIADAVGVVGITILHAELEVVEPRFDEAAELLETVAATFDQLLADDHVEIANVLETCSARLIPLAEARETARAWRRIARAGGDPKAERDKGKRESPTFEAAARRVWAEQIEPHARNAKHKAQWINTLRDYAFPHIGTEPVREIDQSDVLRVLAPIWTEKAETARRVRQRVRTVMDWARAAGYFEGVNPVEGVEKGSNRRAMSSRGPPRPTHAWST